MSADRGFDLHPEAARDITAIWEYIAADSVEAAGRVRKDILAAIRALVPFPNQGHRRPDLTNRPMRFKVVRDYLIAYVPATDPGVQPRNESTSVPFRFGRGKLRNNCDVISTTGQVSLRSI